jgi:hypothetical protein
MILEHFPKFVQVPTAATNTIHNHNHLGKFFYLSLYLSNLSFCLLLGILLVTTKRTTGTVRWGLWVRGRTIGRDEEDDDSEQVCFSFFIKNLLTII